MLYPDFSYECPEEDIDCDAYADYMDHLYDMYKDDATLCTTKDEALILANMGFGRFLSKDLKEYVKQQRNFNDN